ncbi:type I restriction enzyme endonuclease domain-containing protein [Vreelandella alkaliphila]|uniref:type I restriction enzyme endonuclease domain-containing protein n=1 Tax=Vreelandella alkaliphila TaxID=272774 RepID=UPI00232C61D0|nr:type I restriction enzyme endonuclease domain-containing protein [Halomonas alkaliphila]
MDRDEALGLSADQIAFYDALITNESAVRELGDDKLRALAVEVTNKLRARPLLTGRCAKACAPSYVFLCAER